MKRLLSLVAVCFLFFSSLAFAGGLKKPAKKPSEISREQKAILQEGVSLHDQGDYDGAIKKYESVLQINPDAVDALYEMSFSCLPKRISKNLWSLRKKEPPTFPTHCPSSTCKWAVAGMN
jgi:tetratricopeptide (TPR) repeat protein